MTDALKVPVSVVYEKNDVHECTYTYHPQHRDRTPTKSQWTIVKNDELQSFRLLLQNKWIADGYGWSIHLVDDGVNFLGLSSDGTSNLLVAKYSHDNEHNDWHGYPANHIFYARDIPPSEIVLEWVSKNYMTSAKMRKILKGQPCNL